MISLSILMDFCSSWYWWWILPFLFGILLGYVLWARFKRRAAELEQDLARYRSTVNSLENDLNKSRNDRTVAEAKLATAEEKLGTREKQVSHLNKEVFELKQNRKKNMNLDVSQVGASKAKNKKLPGILGASAGLGAGGASMAKESPKPEDSSKETQSTKGKEKKDGKTKGKYKNYSKLLPTNLQIIEGIGPKLESILKENGIGTWKELSSKSRGELRAMLESYGSRYSIIDPSGWPRQAFKAMNADWEGLVKIQTEDGSDSKLKKVAKKLGLN